jgi:hypothetical protein
MKEPFKITGAKLTNSVVKDQQQKGCEIVLKNLFVHDWESDVFAIKDGMTTEYEIKVSRSDFNADFNKIQKHERLQNSEGLIPNQFYYVVPEGLIEDVEVPEYAGLIVMVRQGWFKKVKEAPVLHSRPIEPDFWQKIAMKLYYKTI